MKDNNGKPIYFDMRVPVLFRCKRNLTGLTV